MGVILRLIAAGVPSAKIIAKHGKKAYNAAKLEWKGIKRLLNIDKPVKIHGKEFKPAKIHGKEFKPAKIHGKEFEQKKGGTVSKYSKGGGVRKSKYSL